MGKKKKRWTEDESSSSSSSSSDDISTEETTNRRRRSEARRTNRKKEGKVISILTELKEEMCKLSKKFSENKDDTCEIRKLLEKLTENHSDQSKRLEKLTESYNDLRKQLELHTNKGTSGDDSAASRSQSYHVQPPRYRLEFRSGVIDKIEKGQSIEISVALVDCKNKQTVETGSLASATVELVVVNAEFNQHDNQYNWSREHFESNIKKARQGNLATGDVDQSVNSIVSNGRFNLVNGVKCHSSSKIFSNSSNKKVRLGVMVVSPTEERVLEGLSNPFFVRGHDRPNRQCRLPDSRSNRQGLHNGYQEQNGLMPYMQNPSWVNSIQDEQLASDYFMGLNTVESNFFRTPGNIGHELSSALVDIGRGQNFVGDDDHVPDHAIGPEFNMNQTICPVHLVWDRPNVEPRKRHWNLLDQLMPLYSCQRKWNEFVLPTMRLTSDKTRRRGGVLIEPLEADDSDAERLLKRRLHRKYRLRFVRKVCKAYYTMKQIKADDGNHIKVALFDENNTKVTSGPLSSASVEVVVLHGDFNDDGQDYWTSEEFKRCVICPQPGKVEAVLGGDSILVLDDGEACLGDAFFQVTSFLERTRKFKMGVMLASTQERIQEGISEPFLVMARRREGLPPGFRSHPTDEELIHPCTGQPIAEASNREAAAMSEVSVLNQGGEEESPLVLPPGFRFHPTDAEVVVNYLTPKALDSCFTCVVVANVNIHKVEPWDLPGKAKMGEKEWYFFYHKDRKYPTGTLTNRATETGYWKATGKDKEIFCSRVVLVGMKKTLVFYIGQAPRGKKTPWVMHEYRLEGKLPPNLPCTAKDEWVLCRIFYKLRPSQSMDDDEGLISHPLLEFTLPTDLPPGFRFFPTDKELIFHYLWNRATAASGPTSIIAEVDIYKFEPWDLPGKATFGEREWYFFCHRERRYPTGSCVTNRATSSGYWKATGKDRMITLSAVDDKILGFRKTLVFYRGRAPRGQWTIWVMHEYRLADDTLMSTINSTKGSSSSTSYTRDEWLLCRIFTKTNKLQPSPFMDDDGLNQLQFLRHELSLRHHAQPLPELPALSCAYGTRQKPKNTLQRAHGTHLVGKELFAECFFWHSVNICRVPSQTLGKHDLGNNK